jgi:hypothetical protein
LPIRIYQENKIQQFVEEAGTQFLATQQSTYRTCELAFWPFGETLVIRVSLGLMGLLLTFQQLPFFLIINYC